MGDAFKLIIEDDEGKRNVVPVALGEVTVGRLDGNAIRLNERNVSRTHMRLVKENSHVFAEDLDSYNGVFINGSRITNRQAIHEGDLIRVGDFHLELRGEGLARRAEETTQKTIVPDLDSTQPEIHVEEKTEVSAPPSAPGVRMEEATPMPAAAAPVPMAQSEPDEPRAEATAIIRMDHLQSLGGAQPRDAGVITGAKPKLICVATQFAGQEFEISTAEAVIGRTDDNEIAIDHRSVSRHHSKIVCSGNTYKIVDLGSANGTLVNGEQYAQIALKAGDLIELGHVKFRFVPPGSTYNLTEEERAVVSGKAPAALPPTFQDGIPTQVRSTLADHVKANPFGAIGAGAVVLGVLIFVGWLLLSGDKDVSGAQQIVSVSTPSGTVGKIVAKAREFMERREWKKAVRLLELAVEKDPTEDTAIDLLDKAQAELEAEKNVDAANRAIKVGDWNAAWNALNDVPERSVYFRDADSLRSQVRLALITERLSEAQTARDAGQKSRATEILDEIEALNPGNAQAREMRASLDSAAAEPAPRSSLRKSSGGSRGERDSSPAPRAESSKPKPPKKIKQPRPEPEPPPATGTDARSHYKKGIAALQGGQTRKAIDAFNKCVQTDRTYCLCYRALGISHARDGNGPKAARYYKLFLKYCPTHKDAGPVRKLLEAYGQ